MSDAAQPPVQPRDAAQPEAQPKTQPETPWDRAPDDPGLSQAEAHRRLLADGANDSDSAALLSPWQRHARAALRSARDVAREPMFQLLAVAAALYLLLGNRSDALMLLAFVALTVGITLVQDQRTERAVAALRELSRPPADVIRDGQPQRIPSREVVVGDLLQLREGDRIAADAKLLRASDLQVDESLLTGESVPVAMQMPTPTPTPTSTPVTDPPTPPGEAPRVHAGTLVVSGQGLARVDAIGAATALGRIGHALGAVASPDTPLTQQTRALVRRFSVIGLGLSALVVGLWGWQRGDWMGALLAGITLAMSLLPEELLLILTVFMAMGAWRLAGQQVLARRAATIEALGTATVLCTDKTGTLTRNQMAVAELVAVGGGAANGALDAASGWLRWRADATPPVPAPPMAPALQRVLEYGVLASEPQAFDAMDLALHALGEAQLDATRRHASWVLVHEYPLAADRPAMTHVWRVEGAPASAPQAPADSASPASPASPAAPPPAGVVALKGAHEAVARLCRLDASARAALAATADELAARGLRVLAVAQAPLAAEALRGEAWPDRPDDYAFSLLGLIGLADPLRTGAPAVVAACQAAGLRVIMVTGDQDSTARAIARQAGLDDGPPVLLGSELDALDDASLAERLRHTAICARVQPQHKLRIVQALQARGEVVAMTGDGVNDAPSLQAAHIGIAMGRRGTDVAREAASLVLLDDELGAIVVAVRLGRVIHDNLCKAMAFAFAVHVPIAGLSVLPLLLGWPLLFMPVHIACLELLINPVCAFVFESEPGEDDVMRRAPRPRDEPLFTRRLMATSLLQGTLVLAVVALWYGALLNRDALSQTLGNPSEASTRAAAFTTLVSCVLALIAANRSRSSRVLTALRRPTPALTRIAVATVALMALVLGYPPLRERFQFDLPSAPLLLASVTLGALVLLVLEATKALGRPGPAATAALT